jgi:acetylornithine deacetylase/succinyl-diaminopimelate desuccinylase-like protein
LGTIMRRPLRLVPQNIVSSLRLWLGRRRARRPPPAATAGRYVNRILSDAILFNETPSPTENEELRAAFVAERLEEFGIAEVQLGGDGTVSCALPAADPSADYLLLLANTDNPDYSPLGSLVRLTDREAAGLGIADNSVGVATLLVLAEYLHKEQVPLGVNLVLLFTPLTSSAALESFVRRYGQTFRAALFVTGFQLGDVETRSPGGCELQVTVRTADRPLFPDGGTGSAVSVVAAIASRLGSIRWSDDNQTLLSIAKVEAGTGLGYFASEGTMEVEIHSPNTNLLQMARDAAAATIAKTAAEMGAKADVAVLSTYAPADPARSGFLVEALQAVHRELGIKSRPVASLPRRPHLGALDLPVLTVGVTTGRKTLTVESVDLAPIEKGFRQVLQLIRRLERPPEEPLP